MKKETPIQELIKELQKSYNISSNEDYKSGLLYSIECLKSKLKKEKETIIDFSNTIIGKITGDSGCGCYKDDKQITIDLFSEIYNEDEIVFNNELSISDLIKSLNLQKPICFFDTETTGLNVGKDKIVSIAVTKVMPDGTMTSKNSLINPVIPISPEASAIHGYTNDMLVDKPKFNQISKSLYEFMKDCYIAGYNNNFFDNAILQEEFSKCGIDFPDYTQVSLDVCSIFKYFEKRDLSSALKFYCGKDMENAHNAQADIDATVEVFLAQIRRYSELKGKSLEEVAKYGRNENWVDWQGKIIKDSDGDYVWNFGKVIGKKIKNETGFGDWVLVNDFPESFKTLVKKIKAEVVNK
jgi:DNA polymerase-3 subunit epsilon